MASGESLQDRIKRRRDDLFVGRRSEITHFRQTINFLDAPDRSIIINIWGNGGIGKTSLLTRMRTEASALNAKSAFTDHGATDLLAAMRTMSAQLGGHAEALVDQERALELEPEHAGVRLNRAHTLRAMDRFEEAVAGYDEALAAGAEESLMVANRANAFASLGRYEEALADHDRALEIEPGHSRVLLDRAHTLRAMERYEEAIDAYGVALDAGATPGEAHVWRAEVEKWLGRLDAALVDYRAAYQADQSDPLIIDGLAEMLGVVGRDDEALAVLTHEAENGTDVRAERARFLLLADRAPEAIAALDAEPERDRDHWWHIWRGVARLRAGDAASASADIEQARCLAEGSESWPTDLGLSYLLTGDAAGAEREFRQMLASKRGAGAAVVAAVEIGHIRRLVPDLPHADETLALLREHADRCAAQARHLRGRSTGPTFHEHPVMRPTERYGTCPPTSLVKCTVAADTGLVLPVTSVVSRPAAGGL